MMIGGAATGAFLLANSIGDVKHTLKDVKKVFKGAHWKDEDYRDLLCLLYSLIRIARANPVDVEAHIEDPESSSVFSNYPKILADRTAVELICDTIRAGTMNYDDPHQVEEVLEKRLEEIHHHAMHPSHVLQTMADGLPALGICSAYATPQSSLLSVKKRLKVTGIRLRIG